MPGLYARLLGAPSLTDGAGRQVESLLAQPKRFAVLAYLLVEANGTPVTRDKVAALFWPELDQSRARQALRQSLHVIRKELGDDAILGVGAEMLQANAASIGSDVAEFEAALARGDAAAALAAYRGHFLDAFRVGDGAELEHWADGVRTRLRLGAVRAAQQRALEAESAGELDDAARWLTEQLRIADIDERTLRKLLALLQRRGDGAGALAVFEDYAERMRRELEVEPSAETATMVERIRAAGVPVDRRMSSGIPAAPSSLASSPQTSQPRERLFTRRNLVAAGGLVVLAVVAAAVANDAREPDASVPPSVAVLPFLDLSPARDHGYLSDGITEELITSLSQVRGLRVPGRTSSFAYRDARADVPRIGRELRVGAVLEGSVRVDGDRLRITAQLIDARTGYHLWSQNYDRASSDLLAVQGEIAGAIARALRVQLVGPGAGAGVPAGFGTARAASHEAYLKGRYFWNQRDADGIRTAIEMFERAIALDSTYALPFAGLASAYQLAPNFTVMAPDTAFPLAMTAVRRALALDPDVAEARAALGFIKLQWERDFAAAERELRRATELNPGYATAWQWLRLYYIAVGRLDDALFAARRARDLDPASVSIQCGVGDVFYYRAEYDSAAAQFREALRLDPEFDRALSGAARVELILGNRPEAIVLAERAAARPTRNARYVGGLGMIYGLAQRPADARRMLDSVRTMAGSVYVPPYAMVLAHLGVGNADSTLYWFRRAQDTRDAFAIELWAYPEFGPIAKDARFISLVARGRAPVR